MSLTDRRRRNGVTGFAQHVNATLTRPANTITYTAGDVIAASTSVASFITFTDAAALPGNGGVILGATILNDANQVLLPMFELWLFNTAPTARLDDTALALSDSELQSLIGIIPFTTNFISNAAAGATGNSVAISSAVALPFETTTDSTAIYGLLVTRNAYVPVASNVFTIKLTLLQD